MAEFHPLRSKHDIENDPAWEVLNEAAEELAKNCQNADLPSLDHLTFQDYQHVYEPSDDTYLLLDALQYEFDQGVFANNDEDTSRVLRVLEIGCGSGVPSVFFRMQCKKQTDTNRRVHSTVTDVNTYALKVTRQTAIANNIISGSNGNEGDSFQAIECDLASALLPEQAGTIDVLLFNPPYVPTPDDEVGSSGIEASWAGGVNGRRVVDRALEQIAKVLRRPEGVVYMITVDDNRPVELAGRFAEYDLEMKPLFRRRVHNEYLTVQKIAYKCLESIATDEESR